MEATEAATASVCACSWRVNDFTWPDSMTCRRYRAQPFASPTFTCVQTTCRRRSWDTEAQAATEYETHNAQLSQMSSLGTSLSEPPKCGNPDPPAPSFAPADPAAGRPSHSTTYLDTVSLSADAELDQQLDGAELDQQLDPADTGLFG